MKLPKEFILEGTDNNGMRHRYSIEKNEQFKDVFIKFMEELGFDSEKISKRFIRTECDKKTGEQRTILIRVADLKDVCHYYKNREYEADIFYGNRKIILIIRTNQKRERVRRRKMLDNLESKSKWKKFYNKEKKESIKIKST